MSKTILTLSTALVFAAGMFGSTAEAGSCGGGGGYRNYGYSKSYRSNASSSYYKRVAQPKAIAPATSKTAASPARTVASEIAAASSAEKATPIAEPAIAALDAAPEPIASNVGESRSIGCKRFIPAAGLTISVACE